MITENQYAQILIDKSKVEKDLALIYVFNGEQDVKKFDELIKSMENTLKDMEEFMKKYEFLTEGEYKK